MNSHKHAIVVNHSPFTNDKGKEALELALTLATYEQSVALFFKGDAPLQLLTNINADILKRKNYSQGFSALNLYDIEDVYIHADSLAELQINGQALAISAGILSDQEFTAKLNQFDVVLQF